MKNLGILLLLIVISFASCSKPDEYYKDLLIYSDRNNPGKLQNLKGSNGYYRLKIKYDIPPNNSVSKIVLKGATDSLVFDVPEGKSGTKDSLIVKDLMETNYRYQIYSLNKDNVKSIKRELSFKIYGDRYKSSLTTLNVRSKATVNTNDLRLIFNGDRANVLAKSNSNIQIERISSLNWTLKIQQIPSCFQIIRRVQTYIFLMDLFLLRTQLIPFILQRRS